MGMYVIQPVTVSCTIQCPSGTQYEVEEVDLPSDYEMTSAKRTKGTVFGRAITQVQAVVVNPVKGETAVSVAVADPEGGPLLPPE